MCLPVCAPSSTVVSPAAILCSLRRLPARSTIDLSGDAINPTAARRIGWRRPLRGHDSGGQRVRRAKRPRQWWAVPRRGQRNPAPAASRGAPQLSAAVASVRNRPRRRAGERAGPAATATSGGAARRARRARTFGGQRCGGVWSLQRRRRAGPLKEQGGEHVEEEEGWYMICGPHKTGANGKWSHPIPPTIHKDRAISFL
ncbi:hypothetical protein PVAP13_9NG592398 [Panicum virgatum]|uniref:Uncharacterized protein n=1 Tax=Panicum virgatum TaxID=38727 RepID=A0A8T0MUX2_PANVG|nr:hypothetical protein PVAP13_9NG592398 [Panicum virgatum]